MSFCLWTMHTIFCAVTQGQIRCKKKRHVKNVMSVDTEEVLIDWIREAPCLYQKGLRDYRDKEKRSRLLAKKAAEMDMTGEYFFSF